MYHGDIRIGETIDIKFTTRQFSTGAPFTLAGTPSVAAYIGNSTTEITAGITLTVDFDARTGLNNVRVVATTGNGYATGTNVALVITAGTVDSVSVVGEVVGTFSIGNRSAFGVLGALSTAASTGDPGTTTTLTAYLKQLINILIGTAGIATFPAESAPGNAVSLSEVIRAIHSDVTGLNGDAMRGTDSAALAATALSTANWTAARAGYLDNINNAALQTTAAQTGDSYARIGAAGAGLTAMPWNASWDAEVQSEADDALVARGLHYVANTALPTDWATDIAANSALDYLADDGTATFDRTTDSQQAIADSGGGGPTAAQIADAVWDEPKADHTTSTTFGDLATDLDSVLADTNELQTDDVPGLIAALNDLSAAEVNAEADTALADYDGPTYTELLNMIRVMARSDAAIATDLSAVLTAINTDLGSGAGDFANTTEALEAIRDRGDAAWITATGFSTHTAADVRAEMDSNSTQLAAIVADTNELQTDDVPGLIAALNDPTAAAIADAVWDEPKAGHTTSTTFGDLATDLDSALADTNELQTDWADGGRLDVILDARASQASVDTVDGNVDAILLDTNELQTDDVPGLIAALNDLSAAEVNAEVVDALATDTYSEPGQGAPAATASLAAKIGYLYKAWRNRKTQTSSQYSLYNDDAATIDQLAAVSDDGSTTNVGEIASGP